MKNWFPALTSRKFQAFVICLVILAVIIIPQTSYAWVDFGCRTAIFDLNCGIGELLYNLAAAFAFICGNILDLVVRFFVFEMTTTLETGNLFALQEGDIPTYRFVWFIVRDLANLSFIFILIYAALATIFQIQSVNIRRVIPQLILVAILMNFSLFFVQVATDFSNYLSYQFFTAVEINVAPDDNDGNPVGLASDDSTTAQIGQSQQQGLSNIIMNVTRITALIGTPEASNVDNLASSGSTQNPGIAFGVFASIFTIIGALVMLAGAMLLFIRFFMIVIYMIASPIAFAASITQGGKDSITKNWWLKGLTAQLAFAPAYFGLLYLSLIFLSAMTGEGAFNPSGNEGILAYWVRNAMIFIVSSAFLIFALIASKRLGAVGGQTAMSFVKRTGFAMTAGGAAMVGRNTIGRASRKYVNSNQNALRQRIASGGLVSRNLARAQLKTGRFLQNSSYDSRMQLDRIPGVKMSDISYGNRKSVGKGYDERLNEKRDAAVERAMDVAEALDDEQRERYFNKLDTKKDGLRGVLQFATHEENIETGRLEGRDWAENWHNNWVGRTEDLSVIEDVLLENNPGLTRRKTAAVLNRFRNFVKRNDPIMGGGNDDENATREQAQEITRTRLEREIEIREIREERSNVREQQVDNNQNIAELTSQLANINQGIASAIDQGNQQLQQQLQQQANQLQQTLNQREQDGHVLQQLITHLNDREQQVVIETEQAVNEWREIYSRQRAEAKTSGGFVNTAAAQAVRNFRERREQEQEERVWNRRFGRLAELIAQGQYSVEELETFGDPVDPNRGEDN